MNQVQMPPLMTAAFVLKATTTNSGTVAGVNNRRRPPH